jgi:hypothetical protein
MVIAAVIVAGCGGGTGGSTAASSPSNSSTPPATTAAATPSSGGTADEAAWLAGVVALGKKMIGPTSGEQEVTAEYLREEAERLSSCNAELAQLGPPPDLLRSVLVLAEQACDKYEEGAECYMAAGSNIEQSNECLDAINEANELIANAEATGEGLTR